MKKIIFLFFLFVAYAALAKNLTYDLSVTDKGFEPKAIDIGPNNHLTLNITRKSDATCAADIIIPDKKIKQKLPLNKTVKVVVGTLEKGEVRFGCSMNMMEGGVIFVR